ncbi:MAG: PQQ-binding-like beta-propeller repeat protein [Deltaproteobacteria bacterium]|nr:PQQ-binding-like beta-propeller repeat protein [Deltaproteobacteria bacterium]
MKKIWSALALLCAIAPTHQAAAEAPLRIDERGIPLVRPESLPRRTYAFSTFVVGTDDVHIVVSEGTDADRPARWLAVDNRGNFAWSADHACPNFDDYTTLFTVDQRVVCKWRKQIVAIDTKTGKEAWRFSDPRPMYITAGAAGRVAVSIDNQQLAVLDAATGREVARYDVDGAVLEAVAATAKGPMALLVQDTPGVVKDTIELPTGEGGALEKVELSGDDAGRRLVAVAIGGKPQKGIAPMKPAWTTPFEGYSFDVQPTAGVVVGLPREGIRAGWDLADGKLLWERKETEGELFFFGDDGGIFAHRLPGVAAELAALADYSWGAVNARTLKPLWELPLPAGDRPMNGGQGGGDAGIVTTGGFLLARYADGQTLASARVDPGYELVGLRSTKRSVLWVVQRDDERWVRLRTLGN